MHTHILWIVQFILENPTHYMFVTILQILLHVFCISEMYCEAVDNPSSGQANCSDPPYQEIEGVFGVNTTYHVECNDGFLPESNNKVACVLDEPKATPAWNDNTTSCRMY